MGGQSRLKKEVTQVLKPRAREGQMIELRAKSYQLLLEGVIGKIKSKE